MSPLSARTRVAALAVTAGLVAGGAAFAAAPAFAAEPTPVATVVTPDGVNPVITFSQASIEAADVIADGLTFTISGMYPNTPLHVSVTDPSGAAISGYPMDVTTDASGSYSGAIALEAPLTPGTYTLGALTTDATLPMGVGASQTFEVTGQPEVLPPLSPESSTEAPTPTETATPAPSPAAGKLGGTVTNSPDGRITATEAAEAGVSYLATGFSTPGAVLQVSITEPGGETYPVTDGVELVVDEAGMAMGTLDFLFDAADIPLGDYVITLTDPTTGETVDITFTIVGADGAATAAPVSGSQGGSQPELANTGADAFGPASLALATLVAGAGALVASRRLAK